MHPLSFARAGMAAFALVLAAGAAPAQQALVPGQSEVSFVSRQMGVPVSGRFARFSARVAFEPSRPEAAQIAFTVDTASAALGSSDTEAELRKPEWLDVARFPSAQFQSSQLRALGGGRYEVTGTLTLKGAPRPLTFLMTLTQAASPPGLTRAEGGFVVKRLDHRVGAGEWGDVNLVADEVQVRFRLALSGVAPL